MIGPQASTFPLTVQSTTAHTLNSILPTDKPNDYIMCSLKFPIEFYSLMCGVC